MSAPIADRTLWDCLGNKCRVEMHCIGRNQFEVYFHDFNSDIPTRYVGAPGDCNARVDRWLERKAKAGFVNQLGAFERWMNRSLAKVQVYTWKLANELEYNCPCIRLLKPYRDEANKKFRWRLAQCLKARRFIGRIALPHYDEAKAEYTN